MMSCNSGGLGKLFYSFNLEDHSRLESAKK